MGMRGYRVDNLALMFLGEDNIPAIGPFFSDKEDAVRAINSCLVDFDRLGMVSGHSRCSVTFFKQPDGRYTLILNYKGLKLEALKNLDELMLKRFRKGLKKKLFVVTSFYEGKNGDLECLALTQGLGAVLVTLN
jgi:hypothetical protein